MSKTPTLQPYNWNGGLNPWRYWRDHESRLTLVCPTSTLNELTNMVPPQPTWRAEIARMAGLEGRAGRP